MPLNRLVTSFNAGVLSPQLVDRTDLEKYASGCLTLQNFLVMQYGGVRRRPGMEWMGELKSDDAKVVLIPFEFSTDTSFLIEAGNQYFRFWTSDGQIEDPGSPGNPLEIATPFLTAELQEIQHSGLNDTLYLVHPNHPPQVLTRVADNDWTIAAVDFNWPAFLEQNTTATTITSSSATGTTTLTASASLFDALHVGSYWRITHNRTNAFINQAISSNTSSASKLVIGKWVLQTFGTWVADVRIEESTDNVNWTVKRLYNGDGGRNILDDGTETVAIWMRITIANYVSNTNAKAVFDIREADHDGLVKITGVTNATTATATVVRELASTSATKFWSEGAWSAYRGYPRAVTFHQLRLWLGGTESRRTTFWGSCIDDFTNFLTGVNADQGLSLQVASRKSNIIQWLSSQSQGLVVGTSGNEWRVIGRDSGTINFDIIPQTNLGSEFIPPVEVDEGLIFVERKGRGLQELAYTYESDGYTPTELTLLAEHVTEGEIVDMAFQQKYEPILWFVTGDGVLLSLTYRRRQGVVGWGVHLTDGEVEAVACKYGPAGAGDEVWIAVKRTIDNSTKRYLERIDPAWRVNQEAEDLDNLFYVDCGVRIDLETPGTTVTGLEHLEGKEVSVMADGSVHPNLTVTDGEIELQAAAQIVVVGLPYTSIIEPMPQFFEMAGGSSAGRRMQISQISLRLYKSLGFEVAATKDAPENKWKPYYFRSVSDNVEDPVPLQSDRFKLETGVGWQQSGTIAIRQTQPLPLTILSLIAYLDTYGN